MLLEYDGSCYHGWQKQKDVATVQAAVECALTKFLGEKVNTIVAGRTDTGVHALNQVFSFSTQLIRPTHSYINGVNAFLASSIRIKDVLIINNDNNIEFNARYAALSRTYHYYLLLGKHPSVIFNGKIAWIYQTKIDIVAINDAIEYILGMHDFSSFRGSSCQALNPVRNMLEANVLQQDKTLRFSFKANAFLYHMIRNIVGALIYVGINKLRVEEFKNLLAAKNRKLAPPTFMADGLYLIDVEYEQIKFNNKTLIPWLYMF